MKQNSVVKGDVCPKCGKEMKIDASKYPNAVIWLCNDCGVEIYIGENQK